MYKICTFHMQYKLRIKKDIIQLIEMTKCISMVEMLLSTMLFFKNQIISKEKNPQMSQMVAVQAFKPSTPKAETGRPL